MTVILTVHGTSSGDPSDDGHHWWQRNSDFQKRLSKWLDLDKRQVRLEPFHWGLGPNSELARRAAGLNLYKQLTKFEKSAEDYFLIGHSHGGSVIHHALVEAAGKEQTLPHLKQWVTIGTPFILMRMSRLAIARLGHTGKVAYILMVSGIFTSFTIFPLYYQYGKPMQRLTMQSQSAAEVPWLNQAGALDAMIAVMLLLFLIVPLLIYALLRRSQARTRRRYSQQTTDFIRQHFITRWYSLRSPEDEAINALRAAKPIRISLFDRRLLVEPAKSFMIFALMVIYTVLSGWQLTIIAKHGLSPAYFNEINNIYPESFRSAFKIPDFSNIAPDAIQLSAVLQIIREHPIITLFAVLGALVYIPLTVVVFWFLIWLTFWIIHLLFLALGLPASWFLNRLTENRLKENAFGNDTRGEYVVAVSPMPAACDRECGAVPDSVQHALAKHVEQYSALALARARKVLGMNNELSDRSDIAQMLADQLTGSELIHTAYFEVDASAKLVAIGLHNAHAGTLATDFEIADDCASLIAPSAT